MVTVHLVGVVCVDLCPPSLVEKGVCRHIKILTSIIWKNVNNKFLWLFSDFEGLPLKIVIVFPFSPILLYLFYMCLL